MQTDTLIASKTLLNVFGKLPMGKSSSNVFRPVARSYDRGEITLTEFVLRSFEAIRAENVELFLEECPAELLPTAIEFANEEPDDDREWPRVMPRASILPEDQEVRARVLEKEKQDKLEWQARIRAGVRVFREAMKSRE